MKTFKNFIAESAYTDGVKSGKHGIYDSHSHSSIMLPGYVKGHVDFYVGHDKGPHADKARYYANKVEQHLKERSFASTNHDRALNDIYHNAMNAHIEKHVRGSNAYTLSAEHHDKVVEKAENHHKNINDLKKVVGYSAENEKKIRQHQDALNAARDAKNTRGSFSSSKGIYLKSKFDSLSDKANKD